MNVRIDKAGRFVLPKSVRERLGVKNGGTLTIEEGPEGVTLKSKSNIPRFVDEDGILVFTGKQPKDFDWEKLRDNEREARLQELWER